MPFVIAVVAITAIMFNAWLEKRDMNILGFAVFAFCLWATYQGVTR